MTATSHKTIRDVRPGVGGRRAIDRRNCRRGNVVVLTAVMLVVLFGMVAFAIDVGFILNARTELQRTADCCAMAAVAHLPDQAQALEVAKSTATQNYGTVGPDLEDVDAEFGVWNRDTATFTAPPPAGTPSTAVRVALRRTASRGNPLTLFFAHLIGTSQADVTATATAMYDNSLCGPFVGIEYVSAPGSLTTDSYNSTYGPYDPASPRDRASLCSDGPITIEGSATINGDARAGKGFVVTLEGNPVLTGSTGSRLKPLNLPPVDASEAATLNDNHQIPMILEGNSWQSPVDAQGNLVLDGNKSLNLPSGTYYFNDVILSGQATISFDHQTTVYITGDLQRAGGVTVNQASQVAADLTILMTGNSANITSYNDFYGVIYAPNTDVVLDGNSSYFGAIVGKTLTITGTVAGHYDEALSLYEVTLPRRTALVD